MDVEHGLEELGFSRKEAKVYTANVQLGTARASAISKEAGIRRETTYNILDALREKGFVSLIQRDDVNHYAPADPTTIVEQLEEKRRRAEELVPELERLQRSSVRTPLVEFFEGRDGVKTVLRKVLEARPDVVRVISSNEQVKEVLQPYLPQFYLRKRVKRGIEVKLLTDSELLTDELVEYKFLPDELTLHTLCHIYGDTVSMISLSKKPVGTVIDDAYIADTQRKMFDLLWEGL